MSLVPGLVAACLHPAPSSFAVGFSLLLVFWLVRAEEGELRRGRTGRSMRRDDRRSDVFGEEA